MKINGKLYNKEGEIASLHFLNKMSNNLTPYYLASMFPQPVSTISRYNLQNSNDLQTLKARTSLYYHSFLSTAIRGWNNLSKEVKSCDSINSFKNRLKNLKTFLNTITLVDEKHKFYTHAYKPTAMH